MSETELTFRDFAGAIMQGDAGKAGEILQSLLEVDTETGRAAAEHFQMRMQSGGPEFMNKAMGMRTVVTEGSEDQLVALLGDLFDLQGEQATRSAKAVMARFRSAD